MHNDLKRVLPDILRLGRGPALLGELANMTVDQLADTYRELYGEPTRSRNKGYLRKRLAWRIQDADARHLAGPSSARSTRYQG